MDGRFLMSIILNKKNFFYISIFVISTCLQVRDSNINWYCLGLIAVDDDPERAQGNGRCVQEGAETMGETPTEGREGKVGVPQ